MTIQQSLPHATADGQDFQNARGEIFQHIPGQLIEKMRAIRASNNRISVMQQFGIGDTTWRKIQAGQPIRKSVAERLIHRIHSIN